MAFDAFFLSAVLDEVRERCIGARIDKIHQPSRDTLILHMHSREYRTKLLFAANPTAPRLHLTTASPENPAEPPMFCMLLRKHLMGAKLAEVSQPPMERAATFTFDCTDEMGFPVRKKLVAELMDIRQLCAHEMLAQQHTEHRRLRRIFRGRIGQVQPGRRGIGSKQQLGPVIPVVHLQNQGIPAGLVDLVDPGTDTLLPDLTQHRR